MKEKEIVFKRYVQNHPMLLPPSFRPSHRIQVAPATSTAVSANAGIVVTPITDNAYQYDSPNSKDRTRARLM